MSKANTECFHMHCQVSAEPHSSTHTNMLGRSHATCHQSPPEHADGKSHLARGQGCLGYGRGTRQMLLPQECKKPQCCGDRSKKRDESWITDPFKSSLITRQPNAEHFSGWKKKKMLSNHVYRTGLSKREDKLNTIQLISGHSYSQSSFSEHRAFCRHFSHPASGGTTTQDRRAGKAGELSAFP